MSLTQSEQINKLAGALAKAQGAMRGALKDAANPFFKSKYADLASVWEACRESLTANGLSVVQSPSAEGATVHLHTLLMHSSGQWIAGTATATAKDDGPQAVGSTVTYLRRYALQSFAGVAPEDDDGEAAEGRNGKNSAKSAPPPKPAGYDDWISELTATADTGIDALRKAFKESKAEYRQFATKQDNPKIESLKTRAERVKSHAA